MLSVVRRSGGEIRALSLPIAVVSCMVCTCRKACFRVFPHIHTELCNVLCVEGSSTHYQLDRLLLESGIGTRARVVMPQVGGLVRNWC